MQKHIENSQRQVKISIVFTAENGTINSSLWRSGRTFITRFLSFFSGASSHALSLRHVPD